LPRFIRHLLRAYSYLFLALHCLVALALSAVILASPHRQVRIGWLPWSDEALGAALAVFGLTGLILVFLAVIGRARILLMIFALAAFIVIARGFFFSEWRISKPEDWQNIVHFVLGFFLAFVGSVRMKRTQQCRA